MLSFANVRISWGLFSSVLYLQYSVALWMCSWIGDDELLICQFQPITMMNMCAKKIIFCIEMKFAHLKIPLALEEIKSWKQWEAHQGSSQLHFYWFSLNLIRKLFLCMGCLALNPFDLIFVLHGWGSFAWEIKFYLTD